MITVEKNCNGIEGLAVIEPKVFGDERGYFMETYNKKDMEANGLFYDFVQDNQSASKKCVLRGLHFQINHPQDKLVRVIRGEVFDVAVDLRKGSKTFRRILRTDFWCSPMKRNLPTRSLIFIIQMMRAGYSGTTGILLLTGPSRREPERMILSSQKRTG